MKRDRFAGYHRPNTKEILKVKNNYLKIKMALEIIQTDFVARKKTYVYVTNDGRSIGSVELNLSKKNLMHLCGLKYDNGARQFYQGIKSDKLNWSKIWIKDDGTTFQKLAVIDNIDLLNGLNAKISIGKGNKFAVLQYNNLIRSGEDILALAITRDDNNEGIPISLLNLKMKTQRRIGIPAFTVYAIIDENVTTHNKKLRIKNGCSSKIKQYVDELLK